MNLDEPAQVANQIASMMEAIIDLSIGPSDRQWQMWHWMQNPEFGDLVYVYMAFQPPVDRVGYYDSAWSFVHIDDDEEPYDLPYRERPHETVWYVHTLDDRYIKWGNCKLLRVPTGRLPI